MAIKTREKEINGKTVKVVLLGTLAGISVSSQITKLVVPGLERLQATGDFIGMASDIIANLDQIDYPKILKQLFDGATVDDFPINVDTYFSGNYGEFVQFLAFAIQANFESFFSVAGLSDLITANPQQ